MPLSVVKAILKTAKTLRAIVYFDCKREIEEILSPMIIKSKSLEYIGVVGNLSCYGKMIEAIEYGLFKTKNKKREKLTIAINMQKGLDIDKFMIFIERIVNLMSVSNIGEYSVKVDNNEDYFELHVQDVFPVLLAVCKYVKSSPLVRLVWANQRDFR